MRTDAFIGLIAVCAIAAPASVYFILRRKIELRQLAIKWWLALYLIAFLAQPIFLLRKHWEAAWVLSNSSLPVQWVAQADNAWWEELAKLLALLIIIWLARDRIKPLFKNLPNGIALGYWAGLAYGAGEAVVLGVLFILPQVALSIFSLHTFSPVTLGWEFVYDRFWAIQLHAVMGALIGAGLWCWFSSKRGGLVVWFVVAMLYHDFVDGQIIMAPVWPGLANFLTQLGLFLLPLDTALGYLVVFLAYRLLDRSRRAQPIAPEMQSTN